MKALAIAVFILSILGTVQCNAEAIKWAPMEVGSGTLNDIGGSSGDARFAVGDKGLVYFFDGASWSVLRQRNFNFADLNAVWAAAPDDVYVAGEEATLLHYDGSNWDQVNLPQLGLNDEITDLWGDTSGPVNKIYAVGIRAGGGSGFALRYDGSSWVSISFHTFENDARSEPKGLVEKLFALPDGQLFAYGRLESAMYRFDAGSGEFVEEEWLEPEGDRRAMISITHMWGYSGTNIYALNASSSVKRLYQYNGFGWARQEDVTSGSAWQTPPFHTIEDAWAIDSDTTMIIGAAALNSTAANRIYHYTPPATWTEQYDITLTGRFKKISAFGLYGSDTVVLAENVTNQQAYTNRDYKDPSTDKSTGNDRTAGSDQDPVNTFSGELYSDETRDLDLGGPMPLYFQRYYGSFLRRSHVLGDLGNNWLHNFDAGLVWNGNTVTYISNKGRVTRFLKDLESGIWTQTSNTDTPYQPIIAVNQDVTLYDPIDKRIYTFDFTTSSLLAGKLVRIEDGKGNLHTLSYDLQTGQLQSVADGLGRTLSFSYNTDTLAKIQIVADNAGRSVAFQYTDAIDSENLTIFTDAEGESTRYAYQDTSATGDYALMINKTLPRANTPFVQTYNAVGQVASQTDAGSNTYGFAYDAPDTTLTDPLGNTRVHTHTTSGELRNRQDQQGESFSMGSDATGRRNAITDRLGDTTGFGYHAASGRLATVTHADGTSSSYAYTARSLNGITHYDLIGITYADSTTEGFVYDASGNVSSHVDQVGNAAAATFNSNGQVLAATNRAGGGTSNTYNGDATVASTTDVAGNLTSFDYDAKRRLDLITHVDSSTVSFSYDDRDALLTVTDENGSTTSMTYDANGNLASSTDPLGNATAFAYDGNDRLISTTGPLSGVVAMAYDSMGEVASITDANANTTSFDYDSRGRLTTTTEPLGNSWLSTYDAEAILTSSTDPLGNTTSLVSDQMGRITQAISPLGHGSSVGYDAMGRVITSSDALGKVTTLGRDARGLLTAIDLPGSTIATSYTRNPLGQITRTTDPNANNWDRTFDSSGRQTSSTDPLGNVRTNTYDNRNRLSVVTYPGNLGTLTMGYDNTGQLTRRTYSDGTVLNYAYNANGQLTAANGITSSFDANSRKTESNGITAGYDAGGRITSMTLAVGKTVTYSYDANDRLSSVTDWAGGVTGFSYDAANRLIGIARPNGIDRSNSYDADSRLTSFSEGTVTSATLTRDGRGQITAATRTRPSMPVVTASENTDTFDAASQQTGATYDALGRLTAQGVDSYTWDLASRLSSYSRSGSTVTASYDAGGFRLSRTQGGVTHGYVWNYLLGLPVISIEKQAATPLQYYIHSANGQLLYSMDAVSDARAFYHFDEMGNTDFVTDDTGSTVASYAYSPFGRLITSTGGLDNPFTWQGALGVMHEGDGFYYVRARYYDALAGRFISRDVIKGKGPKNVNPYQYAYANPLRWIDVTGKEPLLSDQQKQNILQCSPRNYRLLIGSRALESEAATKELSSREANKLHADALEELLEALDDEISAIDSAIKRMEMEYASLVIYNRDILRAIAPHILLFEAVGNRAHELSKILAFEPTLIMVAHIGIYYGRGITFLKREREEAVKNRVEVTPPDVDTSADDLIAPLVPC